MSGVEHVRDMLPGDILFMPMARVAIVSGQTRHGRTTIVEAMPSGARMRVLTADEWRPGNMACARLPEDYPRQRDDAGRIARLMTGTPYSFASYLALALWRLGLRARRLEAWIDRREAKAVLIFMNGDVRVLHFPVEAICSVLADQAWTLAGARVMRGVARQVVTPGAMALQLRDRDDVEWFEPAPRP